MEVSRAIFLAATSTLTAVCLLVFVGSYMIRVFLKTILLVVLFGAFHSLFVLPALFTSLDNRGNDSDMSLMRRSKSTISQSAATHFFQFAFVEWTNFVLRGLEKTT